MNDKLIIKSEGKIDPNSFLLLGNSTKRDSDDKIGQFGSGLKYSIAKLLELGINFKTYSGTELIQFETEKVQFRGEEFDRILVNGERTNFTTQMGPQWGAFDAVREIYTNAIDEGLLQFEVSDSAEVEENTTTFILEMDSELKKLMDSKKLYFSHFRNDLKYTVKWRNYYLNIYPSNDEGTRIYKAGFLVYENKDKPALYHYDYSQASINESRQLMNLSSTSDSITTVLAKHAEKPFLKELFEHHKNDRYNPDLFESEWDWWIFTSLSDKWEGLFDKKRVVSDSSYTFYKDHLRGMGEYYVIPERLARKLKETFPETRVYGGGSTDKTNEFIVNSSIPPEWVQRIAKEMNWFRLADCPIPYPVVVAEFKEKNVGGTIDLEENRIVLSERLFKESESESITTTIKEVLFEEFAHLESRLGDRTDGFQDYLIQQVLKYMTMYKTQKTNQQKTEEP